MIDEDKQEEAENDLLNAPQNCPLCGSKELVVLCGDDEYIEHGARITINVECRGCDAAWVSEFVLARAWNFENNGVI